MSYCIIDAYGNQLLCLHIIDQILNLLLGPAMEQLLRIGDLLIFNGLHMENGHIELVKILPLFVCRGHDVQFLVVEGFALVQLDDGVFGRVAEPAAGAGEEGDASGLKEGSCSKHF